MRSIGVSVLTACGIAQMLRRSFNFRIVIFLPARRSSLLQRQRLKFQLFGFKKSEKYFRGILVQLIENTC